MAPTLPRAATRAASLIATTPVAAPTLGLGLGLARPATTTTTLLPLRAAATPTTLAAALARRTYATPAGQPPSRHFRPPPETTWENDKSSLLDRAGKYFLMTEIARGMYILLEQFFRPPYTIYYPFEKVSCGGDYTRTAMVARWTTSPDCWPCGPLRCLAKLLASPDNWPVSTATQLVGSTG
jgi:hypothetical protein